MIRVMRMRMMMSMMIMYNPPLFAGPGIAGYLTSTAGSQKTSPLFSPDAPPPMEDH